MEPRLHRRTLLRGFGTAMALPFLEGMLPLTALAQSVKPSQRPIRMAFLFVPNGINMAHWTPEGEGALGALPHPLRRDARVATRRRFPDTHWCHRPVLSRRAVRRQKK